MLRSVADLSYVPHTPAMCTLDDLEVAPTRKFDRRTFLGPSENAHNLFSLVLDLLTLQLVVSNRRLSWPRRLYSAMVRRMAWSKSHSSVV